MAIQAHFYSDNNNNNNNNFGFPLDNSFMDTAGCGFFDPTPQQQQFVQFPIYKNLNHQSIPLSAHMDTQRIEFQHFLNLQNERLILALEEQRKQQVAVLMKKYESKSRLLLIQKEEEIAKASNTRMELENFLKNMEIEKEAWQTLAHENESKVASLNGIIQRAESAVCFSSAQDAAAESCCSNNIQQNNNSKLMCKCCNSRNSCVVMLPCRHMCCCQDCDLFLDSCPLCRMPKKATIHALI